MIHLLEQLTKLADAGKQLGEVQVPSALYERVFDLIESIFQNQTAAILLQDPRDGSLTVAASRGYDPDVVRSFRVAPGEGVTGYALQTGEPQLVTETVNDPRYIRGVTDAVSEIAVPLRTGGETIGVLDMESREHRFSTADQAMFSTFAEQVVTAIRNLRLMADLEERARRLVSIARIGQGLAQETNLERLLDRVVESVHEALHLDTVAVQLWDEKKENVVVVAARGYDRDVIGLSVRRGTGVTGRVAEERKPVVIDDVQTIPDYVAGLSGCRSEMAVPLVFRDEVIGVLNAEHRDVARFGETDLLHASIFADQTATAIGNARVRDALETSTRETDRLAGRLKLLARTSEKLTSILDLDTLLAEILQLAQQALGFQQIAVLLPAPSGMHLRVAGCVGYGEETAGRQIPIEGSLCGEAYGTGSTVLVSDVRTDPRYVTGLKDARSNVAVPLRVEDEVIGVLNAETAGDEILTQADAEILGMLASQVASAVRAAGQRTELAERSRRLTLIHRAACSVNAIDDPEEMLESILKLAQKALGIQAVAIVIPDRAGESLVVRKALDHGDVEGLRLPIGSGFCGTMFVTGKAGVIPDIAAQPGYVDGTPGARCEMAVPLVLDGETIGILDAEAMEPYAFNEGDLDLFRIFGSQVATAFKKASMIHALEDKARRLTLIHRAACSLNTLEEPEHVLESILKLAQKALGLHSVAVLTPNGDPGHLTVRKAINHGDVEGMRIPIGEGFVGAMFVTGKADIIPDIAARTDYIPGTPGARCEMAVPLVLDGETIGIIDAEAMEPNAFDEDALQLFRVFGSQAATAIKNSRLIRDLELRGLRLDALNKASRAMNTIHDPNEVIDAILRNACEALSLSQCALLLVDPAETGDLVLHAAVGYGDALGTRVPFGSGVTGRAASKGEPVLVLDTSASPDYIPVPGQDRRASEMAAPLVLFDEVIGVLDTESPRPFAFDENDLELFQSFASQAAISIHNARLIKGLEEANCQLGENVAEMKRLNNELENYAAQIAEANENLESQIQQLTALHEAGRAITASLDLDTTLHSILAMTSRIVGCTAGAIRLIDDETKELSTRAEAGRQAEGSGIRSVVDLPLTIGNRTIGIFELVREAKAVLGDDERQMLETMASQAAIAIENARLFETTQRVYYETLKSLAQALEARDDYTRGHSERVAGISRNIATELSLPASDVDTIYNAALLHDIGKIGIRDEVLLAPRKLTPEERAIIEQHPAYGNSILTPLKFLGEIKTYVRHHHERWDGTGYPDRRRAEEIPLASRIIAVADTYDAMTSSRPYRDALSPEVALAEIRRSSGSQFDPAVVQGFLKIIGAN
ncbi:MAG: GAF domain-containing protein [Proteobacteria bacterium]|jgi:putative nucleotidyltransferase with HDIG domain|nr:GAF domain-containing protein [Pseudomonadota bacterium]